MPPFFCCFLLLSVLHDRSLIFKVYNVTVQQVYKELLNGELFWRYSLTVDGVEIGFELNKDGKQFNKMALTTGKGDGASSGCDAQIDHFHHEILDLGKWFLYCLYTECLYNINLTGIFEIGCLINFVLV